MKSLSGIVSELLFEFDCVIVPDLGGFITNYKPAYINPDTQVLFPPTKAIGFNSNLKSNDGLLANKISNLEKISYEEACQQLKNDVETCFQRLNNGQRVEFDKVGILYFDENKRIQFEPDTELNYLRSSYGFFEFHHPKLQAEAKEEEIKEKGPTPIALPIIKSTEEKIELEKSESETPIIAINKRSGKARYWIAASLIPLILYSSVVAWQSDVFNDGNIHSSDLNPFKPFKEELYQSESRQIKAIESAAELDVNIDFKEKEVPKVPSTVSPISLYADEEVKQLPFHIMNGCFSVKSNAEKQTKKLRKQGYQAFILDKKGRLYRVSQGAFTEKSEALALLRKLKSYEAKDAWLLKN